VEALGEGPIRHGVEPGVGDRVEQHLPGQSRAGVPLRQQGHRRGQVGTRRVADHRDPRTVQVGTPVSGQPAQHRVTLAHRLRVARLRREAVVREDHGRAGADGQLPDQPVMGVAVPEDPAATVQVEDHRQPTDGARRPDDPDRHRGIAAGAHRLVLHIHVGFGDGAGLKFGEGASTSFRPELVQIRRVRGRLGKPPGGGFQHDRGGAARRAHRRDRWAAGAVAAPADLTTGSCCLGLVVGMGMGALRESGPRARRERSRGFLGYAESSGIRAGRHPPFDGAARTCPFG